jgi:hypothetical protein
VPAPEKIVNDPRNNDILSSHRALTFNAPQATPVPKPGEGSGIHAHTVTLTAPSALRNGAPVGRSGQEEGKAPVTCGSKARSNRGLYGRGDRIRTCDPLVPNLEAAGCYAMPPGACAAIRAGSQESSPSPARAQDALRVRTALQNGAPVGRSPELLPLTPDILAADDIVAERTASEGALQESQAGRGRGPVMSSRLTHLLLALSAAERELREFTQDHPSNCDCRVCDAWRAAFHAKRDVSCPGSDIRDVVGADFATLEGAAP